MALELILVLWVERGERKGCGGLIDKSGEWKERLV